MKISKWHIIQFAISLIAVSFIYIGSLNILYGYEENGCSMTWMYELPEYIPVPLTKQIAKKFPHYSLSVYGEGSYAEYLKSMKENIQLTGVPALFVHGNAGRFKQVRSLASISLRKSERLPFHFNYFAVDYDEELSGLYGPFLSRQTEFLFHSLERVFHCYKHLRKKFRPNSVIMIGHSMGGLVIRGLYTLPQFKPQTVKIIVTYATPYTEPPLKIDVVTENYYAKINTVWNELSFEQQRNITFLSLGGGFRDYLVRSDLSRVKEMSPFHKYRITSSLPAVWLSTDHQCIVWCNELIRKSTKAFFQVIDHGSKQITNDPNYRADIFAKLFLHEAPRVNVSSFSNCATIIVSDESVKYSKDSIGGACIRLNLSKSSANDFLVYAKSRQLDWFFRCDTNQLNCTSINTISLEDSSFYKLLTEVKSDETYVVQLQQYDVLYVKPLTQSKIDFFSHLSNGGFVNVTLNDNIQFFYLKHVSEPWNTLRLKFSNMQSSKSIIKIATCVPWSREIITKTIANQGESVLLRFFNRKPRQSNEMMHLLMVSDEKNMRLKIKVSFDPKYSFGQLLRFNVNQILSTTLLFTVVFPLASIVKSVRISATYLLIFSSLLIMRILFNVLAYHQTLLSEINRHLVPDIFVFVTSYGLATLFRVFSSVIIKLLAVLLYPISKLFKLLWSNFHWIKYIFIPLYLSWYVRPLQMNYVIIAQLFYHIASTLHVEDENKLIDDKCLLQALLPTTLFSIILPIIIDMKHMIEKRINVHDAYIWEKPFVLLENPTVAMLYLFSTSYLYYLYFKFSNINKVYNIVIYSVLYLAFIFNYLQFLPPYFMLYSFVIFFVCIK